MSSLREYRKKRNFSRTSEPKGRPKKKPAGERGIFVIQRHAARRLHWDFRLEAEGVLKSWAVTNEPSTDPDERRLAVQTEDHPIEYAKFHGKIPKGEYGAGDVLIWDNGSFESADPLVAQIDRGIVKITLHGKRLRGTFTLVLLDKGEYGPRTRWLFFKNKAKPVGLRVPRLKAA